jgi:hypothetical protein
MRSLMILLSALALAGLCAVAATPAVASSLAWRECVKSEGGMYEEEHCSKGAAKGSYEWTEETKEMTTSGKVKLIDSKVEGETASSLECEEEGSGTIRGKGEGSETEVKYSKCEVVKGPCEKGTAKVVALSLPWSTQLEEGKETIRYGIKSPGYKVECDIAKSLKVEVECHGATSAVATNNEAGTVTVEFETESKKQECKPGNAESGEIKGALTIKGKGGVVSVGGPEPEWSITGVAAPFLGKETISIKSVTNTSELFVNSQLEVECKSNAFTGIGRLFGGSRGILLEEMKFENCTVPRPVRAGMEKCRVTSGKFTTTDQLGGPFWSAPTGEASNLGFFPLFGPTTPWAEIAVTNEPGLTCGVSGTYKVLGEYQGEIINSTTAAATKVYQMKCPTPISNFWVARGTSRREYMLPEPLKIGLTSATLEAGKFCNEYQFSLAGVHAGSTFSVRAGR